MFLNLFFRIKSRGNWPSSERLAFNCKSYSFRFHWVSFSNHSSFFEFQTLTSESTTIYRDLIKYGQILLVKCRSLAYQTKISFFWHHSSSSHWHSLRHKVVLEIQVPLATWIPDGLVDCLEVVQMEKIINSRKMMDLHAFQCDQVRQRLAFLLFIRGQSSVPHCLLVIQKILDAYISDKSSCERLLN